MMCSASSLRIADTVVGGVEPSSHLALLDHTPLPLEVSLSHAASKAVLSAYMSLEKFFTISK